MIQSKRWAPLLYILICSSLIYIWVFSNAQPLLWPEMLNITSFPGFESWRTLFFTKNPQGFYQPLSALSIYIDQWTTGPEPAFALRYTNLALHLLNTALIFFLVRWLTRTGMIATITALFFAIHPMHTESIAWAMHRPVLLYSFFFLLSLMAYTRYTFTRKSYFYALSLVFFLASLLSHVQAISLPLALIVIDYFRRRKILHIKIWAEKTPFALLSIAFILINNGKEKIISIITKDDYYKLYELLTLKVYSIGLYFAKLVAPQNLSPFYPWPEKTDGALALKYYLLPLAIVGLLMLLIYKQRRKRFITFGFLFFLSTLIAAMPYVPIENSYISDSQVYLSSTGIFFLLGLIFYNFNDFYKYLSVILYGSYTLWLSIMTIYQIQVWQSDHNLSQRIIQEFPKSPKGWGYKAKLLEMRGKHDKALYYYDKALKRTHTSKSSKIELLQKYSQLSLKVKKYQLADSLYTQILKISPQEKDAVYAKSHLQYQLGKHEENLSFLNKHLPGSPYRPQMLYLRALTHRELGHDDACCEDLREAIQADRNMKTAKKLYAHLCRD